MQPKASTSEHLKKHSLLSKWYYFCEISPRIRGRMTLLFGNSLSDFLVCCNNLPLGIGSVKIYLHSLVGLLDSLHPVRTGEDYMVSLRTMVCHHLDGLATPMKFNPSLMLVLYIRLSPMEVQS